MPLQGLEFPCRRNRSIRNLHTRRKSVPVFHSRNLEVDIGIEIMVMILCVGPGGAALPRGLCGARDIGLNLGQVDKLRNVVRVVIGSRAPSTMGVVGVIAFIVVRQGSRAPAATARSTDEMNQLSQNGEFEFELDGVKDGFGGGLENVQGCALQT